MRASREVCRVAAAPLWIAVVVSFATFAIHTFVGGPRVAAPLLADRRLPPASKWLNYYCWHIATLYTFALGWAYAYVALNPSRPELVVFLSALNAALAMLSAGVAIRGGIHPLRFPSTSLFTLLAALGGAFLLVR
jgi:hypothetical protein